MLYCVCRETRPTETETETGRVAENCIVQKGEKCMDNVGVFSLWQLPESAIRLLLESALHYLDVAQQQQDEGSIHTITAIVRRLTFILDRKWRIL